MLLVTSQLCFERTEAELMSTNRQMAANRIIKLRLIRFAMPRAKQRIMQSTPVLYHNVSCALLHSVANQGSPAIGMINTTETVGIQVADSVS
jgi:hypothetical protein